MNEDAERLAAYHRERAQRTGAAQLDQTDAARAGMVGYAPVSASEERAIDEAAGLVKLTLRLPRQLYDTTANNAAACGVALPAYIRAALEIAQAEDVRRLEDANAAMTKALMAALKWGAWAKRALIAGAALLLFAAALIAWGAWKAWTNA